VNGVQYEKLGWLGKGGSGDVFRVLNPRGELRALKRVTECERNREIMHRYIDEIAYLERLRDNNSIIRLYDKQVKLRDGRHELSIVMECGEADLADLISRREREPLDLHWVLGCWRQVLTAVQVIHDERIVHGDLKPKNFVLVKGWLKLIDFGLARSIPDGTTNITDDSAYTSDNYASPEATYANVKKGRPSDVWSLGCILYQMIYGKPPFADVKVNRVKAIRDPEHTICF
ncbi:kinase-like protein, partial [Auricularia subglabra TFB-10046 SS5]